MFFVMFAFFQPRLITKKNENKENKENKSNKINKIKVKNNNKNNEIEELQEILLEISSNELVDGIVNWAAKSKQFTIEQIKEFFQ